MIVDLLMRDAQEKLARRCWLWRFAAATLATMHRLLNLLLLCLCFLLMIGYGRAGTVSYDHGQLLIDGQPRILISGSIHYPRSTPQMWPDLIAKAKDGGLDVIQTYVFWNMHEPTQGIYNFEGRFDLVLFIKLIQQAGLFASLRIGPYVCAEWNYGGFPVWLHYLPEMEFRTDNKPFKKEMQKFTSKIVEMMKERQLFYSQGGPIILSQIENEYGVVDYYYGAPGKSYMHWAATMALELDTGVPWIMCKQPDAPDPIINTWNGFYCDSFSPNSPKKPRMCTEAWSGWLQSFGGLHPKRPTEDLAFAVARFYEMGGSFLNYYMYHGGTNFGRTAGGPFITTSYDYDAPLDEYGNVRQPKWGHLKDLHQSIKLCEPALVLGDPESLVFGPKQEGHVYSNGGDTCAAFLANHDEITATTVNFNGRSYYLPAWSVSILPDCRNVVYSTAKVNVQVSLMTMKPVHSIPLRPYNFEARQFQKSIFSGLWDSYQEPIGVWGSDSFSSSYFEDQINITKDTTDYLWYFTSIQVNEENFHLQNGGTATLSVNSLGHALHVFINGRLAGSGHGNAVQSNFTLEIPVTLQFGNNDMALLSMTVGLQNVGAFFETWGAGIAFVSIKGLKSSIIDLSSQVWQYQIGLKGEQLSIYAENEATNSVWGSSSTPPQNTSMVWYKTTFSAPPGSASVTLDLLSMGKGQAWINGESIGRYWPANLSPQTGCSSTCDYKGLYNETKCTTNCDQPTQRWYHVPRSWLQPTGNILVLLEEIGGDPTTISFAMSTVSTVCAFVSESYPPHVDTWDNAQLKRMLYSKPEVRIECMYGQIIASIKFASFGNPTGMCGNFYKGSCHALRSLDTLAEACVGKQNCSVTVSVESFEEDPCPRKVKTLAVEAICSEK